MEKLIKCINKLKFIFLFLVTFLVLGTSCGQGNVKGYASLIIESSTGGEVTCKDKSVDFRRIKIGTTLEFNAVPFEGYLLNDVFVDETSIIETLTYTFEESKKYTIKGVFIEDSQKDDYSINLVCSMGSNEVLVGEEFSIKASINGVDTKKEDFYFNILSGSNFVDKLDDYGNFYANRPGNATIEALYIQNREIRNTIDITVVTEEPLETQVGTLQYYTDIVGKYVSITGTVVSIFEDGAYFSAILYDGTGLIYLKYINKYIDLFNDLFNQNVLVTGHLSKDENGWYYFTNENECGYEIERSYGNQTYSLSGPINANNQVLDDYSFDSTQSSSTCFSSDVVVHKNSNNQYVLSEINDSDEVRNLSFYNDYGSAPYLKEGETFNIMYIPYTISKSSDETIKIFPVTIKWHEISIFSNKTNLNLNEEVQVNISLDEEDIIFNQNTLVYLSNYDVIKYVYGTVTSVNYGEAILHVQYYSMKAELKFAVREEIKRVSLAQITQTPSENFVSINTEGTLVSLYNDGNSYSGVLYDGTAVLPLYKFANEEEAIKLNLGDVINVTGIPSRYKDYYWAEMDGSSGMITSWNVVADGVKNDLPEAIKWTGADATSYEEADATNFKHVICDVIASKVGNITRFKIVGSNDTDRVLSLQYTPSDAQYILEGTKSRMEFITGDLKNSDTVVSIYPISIETMVAHIYAPSTIVNVDSNLQLTYKYDGGEVTEGVTWFSSDDSVATVSATGLVKGLNEGKVTITAMHSLGIATFEVTVKFKAVNYISQAKEATIAECNAAAGDATELFLVEGKISKVSKSNNGEFYMTVDGAEAEGDNSLYVYNSCFGQDALSNDGIKWSYNYKNGYARDDFYTVGQSVKILCFRVDYRKYDVTTKEVKGVILTEDPYFMAKKATIDKVLEGDSDQTKLYLVNAYVTSIEKVSYGRFHAAPYKDGTGTDLYVYNSGFKKEGVEAMELKEDGTWNFNYKNTIAPTEETLTVGDKVTLLVYRADYKGTKEVKGLITAIEPGELYVPTTPGEGSGEYPSSVTYDYSTKEVGTKYADGAALKNDLDQLDSSESKLISEVIEVTNIYNGCASGGPGTNFKCLKLGKSGAGGILSFRTCAKIGKVEILYHPWSATRDTNLYVNDICSSNKANEGYVEPVKSIYEFEGTQDITIKTDTSGDPRACILSITLYIVE